jgi:hypothetical protein
MVGERRFKSIAKHQRGKPAYIKPLFINKHMTRSTTSLNTRATTDDMFLGIANLLRRHATERKRNAPKDTMCIKSGSETLLELDVSGWNDSDKQAFASACMKLVPRN